MWMGTHVNGPSYVIQDQKEILLLDFIKEHGEACLGNYLSEQGFNNIPFLFKVLSINKALSIQAHPNKELAEKLHAEYPDIYKDGNHKPELAIALTNMQAMCQFRKIEEIVEFIETVLILFYFYFQGFSVEECFGRGISE